VEGQVPVEEVLALKLAWSELQNLSVGWGYNKNSRNGAA